MDPAQVKFASAHGPTQHSDFRFPRQMTGNYGPAAAAAAAAAAGNTTGRTVYVGNLPPGELFCQALAHLFDV